MGQALFEEAMRRRRRRLRLRLLNKDGNSHNYSP